jgi:hypothetical protein
MGSGSGVGAGEGIGSGPGPSLACIDCMWLAAHVAGVTASAPEISNGISKPWYFFNTFMVMLLVSFKRVSFLR